MASFSHDKYFLLLIVSFLKGAPASRELMQVMLKQSKNSSEVSESPEVVLEEKMGLKGFRKFVG